MVDFNQASRNGVVVPNGTVLRVGLGKDYSTIAAAVDASKDGDTILIDAGTYTNDSALINHKIILEGVGGMVHLVVDNQFPLWHQAPVIVNTDATIVNFDISGSNISDNLGGNGAGIRFHAGNLTVVNSSIHSNQDGIAAWPDTAGSGTIAIFDSEIYNNGNSSGPNSGYVHGMYAGDLQSVWIENSYFHDTSVGHEIKSRAENTTIISSTISSEAGTGSYLIDIPNGGNLTVSETILSKGANAENPNLIAYGEEGKTNAGSTINIDSSTLINHYTAHNPSILLNPTGVQANISNSQYFGLSLPSNSVVSVNNIALQSDPPIALSSPTNTSGADWSWGDYFNSIPDSTTDLTANQSISLAQTPTIPGSTPINTTVQPPVNTVKLVGSVESVAYRFFDSKHGTQFLTSNQDEIKSLLSTRPDLKLEGPAFATASDSDPSAAPVYRFFDSIYGTHFYTTDRNEVASIKASRSDMTYEGVSFKEHLTQVAGDQAVYRFFDSNMGTHFFTSDKNEQTTILSQRPDLVPEGISFYTPSH